MMLYLLVIRRIYGPCGRQGPARGPLYSMSLTNVFYIRRYQRIYDVTFVGYIFVDHSSVNH
jgi:hypothetical protein